MEYIDTFKPIYYNGKRTIYSVSDAGRVRNDKTNKILAQRTSNRGYKIVHLSLGSFTKHFSVHRLVATAFIPNPDNKPTVNHKDGNKSKNDYTNLEWSTHHEQNIHALQTGLYDNNLGENAYKATLSNKMVHNICKLLSMGYAPREISVMSGIKKQVIDHILYKQSWTHISCKYNIDKARQNIV